MATGRQITCNLCGHKTVQGAAQVLSKILFFFCPDCWFNKRDKCNAQMRSVAGCVPAVKKVA